MATFKHISSKNADYGAAEQYLTFEHDEFTMKPTLDKNGQIVPRTGYLISSLNCGDEDFAIACMRSNLKYGKNQKREDVKSHHYIISFDPRDAQDNGLTVDRAQQLGEQFCKEHFRIFQPPVNQGFFDRPQRVAGTFILYPHKSRFKCVTEATEQTKGGTNGRQPQILLPKAERELF